MQEGAGVWERGAAMASRCHHGRAQGFAARGAQPEVHLACSVAHAVAEAGVTDGAALADVDASSRQQSAKVGEIG